MRLNEFLRQAAQPILDDWDEFASTSLPARASKENLRDSLNRLLLAIAEDMDNVQTDADQIQKGKGLLPDNAPHITDMGRAHATDRFAAGFDINQVVAEYRALRASVLRHWTRGIAERSPVAFDEMVRFNEAIDQALTESVAWYASRHERARDLFIGVLSHDLRNPLGAASMSAAALMQSEQLSANHLRMAVRIFNATVRMKAMIEDLLDFTRARMGTGLPIDVEPNDMKTIGSQVIEEMHAAYPSRAISMTTTGNLNGVWDGGRLEQMLSNLIGNAIRHGFPDTPVSLTISGDARDELTLAVHNEGPPIAPEAQRIIFDLMVRGAIQEGVDKVRSGGLGLGLYIARHIALAHGGNITVESSADAGTTFTVKLPRTSRLQGDQNGESGAAPKKATGTSSSTGLDKR